MRWLLLALLPFLSSCAHQFVLRKDAPPERYAEAQQFLHQDRAARLFTKTETMLRVTDWHIGPDSTTYRIDGATDRIVMLNERIRTLTTQDSRMGTRNGAITGAIVGSGMGLLVGLLISAIDPQYHCETGPEEPDYNWSCGRRDDNDAVIILSGVGIGAAIGTVGGALIGSQTGAMRSVVYYPDPRDPRRWEYLPR